MPDQEPATPSKLRPTATPFTPEQSPSGPTSRVRLSANTGAAQESPSKLRGNARWFFPDVRPQVGIDFAPIMSLHVHPQPIRASGIPINYAHVPQARTPDQGGLVSIGKLPPVHQRSNAESGNRDEIAQPAPTSGNFIDINRLSLLDQQSSGGSDDSNRIAQPIPVRGWTTIEQWVNQVRSQPSSSPRSPSVETAAAGLILGPGTNTSAPTVSTGILGGPRSNLGPTPDPPIEPSQQFVYEAGYPVKITNIDEAADWDNIEFRIRELSGSAHVLRFRYVCNFPRGRIVVAYYATREHANLAAMALRGQAFGGNKNAIVLQFLGDDGDWGS